MVGAFFIGTVYAQMQVQHPTEVMYPVLHDTSPPLKAMLDAAPPVEIPSGPPREVPNREFPYEETPFSGIADPARQDFFGRGENPTVLSNFDGIANLCGCYPPDPNGAAGLNHFFLTVNLHFAIYDKQGTQIQAPQQLGVLWTGFPGPWSTSLNNGDPVVLYDRYANRWVVMQFSIPTQTGTNYILYAVSATSDPLGSYYRYGFTFTGTFPDYPKISVWRDGYYLDVASFPGGGNYAGDIAAVVERDSMLVGNTARMVSFVRSASDPRFLPSDADGALPPPGTPNYFTGVSLSNASLYIYELAVNWSNPPASTFSGPTILPAAPFVAPVCASRNCIPQQGTAVGLDALSNRLMFRVQWRNFGGYQTIVGSHTVQVTASPVQAGVRWYELRKSGGNPWSIYQQGTYAPDANSRWMGSIAMDKFGNIALGYSVSSSTMYPSIRFTGRKPGDLLGTMTVPETTIVAGTGNQTGTGYRWGDYTSMHVDPTDDWTMWYTNEYIQTSGTANWRTRIGSFKLPVGTNTYVRGTITNVVGGAPVSGVLVDFTQSVDQLSGTSQANGSYVAGARIDTPATSIDLTLRARKFHFRDTLIAVHLSLNDSLTRTFAMSPVSSPTITVSPTSLIFPVTILGTTRRDSSTARNVGLQTLNISSLTTTNARFAATATSLSLAYADSARIRVAYTPLLSGVDTGRVIILSNDPNSPRVDITLTASAGNHDIGALSLGGGPSVEGPAMSSISKQMAPATEKQAGGELDATPGVNKGKNNLGITISSSFVAPTDVNGNALLNFKALVRNYGAFVETTYQVGWIIDGVAQAPLSNTRPLQVSATDTLVLTWSNPTEGSHVARAWALLATDANRSNDTSAPYNFNVLPPNVIFQEGFNATIPPYPAGWHVKNVDGGGTRTWFQGNPTVFPAFEGASYIGANFQAANGVTIDEWLVTPNTGGLVDAAIVDSLIFWQRAPGLPAFFPDSIQIRISTTDTAVASFTTVLDYFRVDTSFWRRKAYALPSAANRYIAFRYLIYNGGATGDNSNYLGLDAVQIQRTFAATPGWVTQTSGLTTALRSVKAVDPNTGWIGGAGGRVLRTTTSGDTWTSVGGGAIGTADVYAVEAIDANTAFVTTSPGGGGTGTFIYRTINGGASWTQVYADLSAAAFIDAMKMYDANNGIAMGSPVGGRWVILRTTNGGASWVRDTVNAPVQVGTEAGSNNGLATIGSTHIWFASNSAPPKIYRSTNGGASWASSTLPSTATFTAGLAFLDTQYGVAGGNNGNAARTTDGGATWTAVTIGTTGAINSMSASGNLDLFSTKGTNVYRSTDRGATWNLSWTGTIGITLWHCNFATIGSNTRGYVVSASGGIGAFYGTVTGVEEEGAEIPQTFSLMQNYPNPFNPTTKIKYDLPEQATVALRIYNVLGQEVATLANGPQSAGHHEATWDGRNNFGNRVSSGVYFYRFEARGTSGQTFANLKKMLFLK
jgi:photosystem II stability/assembly factor-like uncharacterized protein